MTNHSLTEDAATTPEPSDEMVLAALNAERREQHRFWGRTDPETGEVLWKDRARLDEFSDGVVKKFRAVLTAALAVAPNVDGRPWEPLNGGPVRVGDTVRRDRRGITRIAVVGRVGLRGPWTAEGDFIGNLDDGTWYVRRPAPTPPAEEVEWEPQFGDIITDVEVAYGEIVRLDRMVWTGWRWTYQDHSTVPKFIIAFTLPDGTRARRDGEHEDGTPRFVKVEADQ